MSTTVVPGVLVAASDAEGVAREAALRMTRAILDAIEARGAAAIGLSGGETPREAYRKLARETRIDWSKVDVFQVDERAAAPSDDRSNWGHLKETLLDPAKVPAERAHRMKSDAPDIAAAARDYEAIVEQRVPAGPRGVPVFDLLVLGIGDDGHTASLFPGDPAVDVTDRFVVEVAAKGKREARLTLTAPVIENAKAIVVLAMGKVKNGPLERAWEVGGTLSDTPARIIRDSRGAVTWVIDRAAGGID